MIMLALILIMLVNKNVNRKKKPNHDTWKSPVFSNDLCLEKKSTFQREEERKAFPKWRLVFPSALHTLTCFMSASGGFSSWSPRRLVAAHSGCFNTLEKPAGKDNPLCFPPSWRWWGRGAGLGKEVCFAISRAVLFLRLKRDSRLQSCQSGTFH